MTVRMVHLTQPGAARSRQQHPARSGRNDDAARPAAPRATRAEDHRPMTPRGIRPIRREPPLTPQELAAMPSDKRSTDPLLRLEEEIAALDKTLTTLKSAQGLLR